MNKVNLAAKVEPELAESVRRLAHLGNRTVSREVAEAVRRHVLLELLEIPASATDPRSGRAVERSPHAGLNPSTNNKENHD